MNDRLTIITPTAGRASLRRTLESYAPQMVADDEYIIVGDDTDGPLVLTEQIVAEFDSRFWYSRARSAHHTWGHDEVNRGMALARTGDWLVFNDDDDVATPTALADIRSAIAELSEPRPLMFRFRTWYGLVVWDEPRLAECHIGGHCLVVPNVPERLGVWSDRYNGDWDFIRSTIDLWPNKDADIVWRENLIAWARPTDAEWAELLQPKAMKSPAVGITGLNPAPVTMPTTGPVDFITAPAVIP